MNTNEIRRINLQALADEAAAAGLSQNAFAKKIKVSGAGVSTALARKKQIGEEMARKAEIGMGRPVGWLDVDHSAPDIDHKIRERLLSMTPEEKQALLVLLPSKAGQSPE